MSYQMTLDWIEQEYDRWSKDITHSPRDAEELERSQYIAKLFAEYILKKAATQNTRNKSEDRK